MWAVLRYEQTWEPEVEEVILFDDKADAEKYIAQSPWPGASNCAIRSGAQRERRRWRRC
jgi:hypothetical protein